MIVLRTFLCSRASSREPLEVFRPVLPQHVGDGRHRTTPTSTGRWWPALFLAQGRQMEIDRRRLQGTVTQILLDESQVDPRLEQVRGVAMSQGVDRDPLRNPSSWTTRFIAPWTLERAIGWPPGASAWSRPVAGNNQIGWRCVTQYWRSTARSAAGAARSGPSSPCHDGHGRPSARCRCRRLADSNPLGPAAPANRRSEEVLLCGVRTASISASLRRCSGRLASSGAGGYGGS